METLEILICTFDERITAVSKVLSAPVEGVRYLVSFQYSDEQYLQLIPADIRDRADVSVFPFPGRGLSVNRNHALHHATGDILLIADDDVRYEAVFFQRIMDTFRDHPEVDIACFQAESYEGVPLRRYPDCSFTYDCQPRGNYFLSVEIAMRRRASLPAFDARFGIGGSLFGSGEEEVFLYQAYRNHLVIRYFPLLIVRTNGQTTGRLFLTDVRIQQAKGGVLCVIHGPVSAWLRCAKFALLFQHGRQFFPLLREMTRGIIEVTRSC